MHMKFLLKTVSNKRQRNAKFYKFLSEPIRMLGGID